MHFIKVYDHLDFLFMTVGDNQKDFSKMWMTTMTKINELITLVTANPHFLYKTWCYLQHLFKCHGWMTFHLRKQLTLTKIWFDSQNFEPKNNWWIRYHIREQPSDTNLLFGNRRVKWINLGHLKQIQMKSNSQDL